jgi:hypothetical protein
MKKSFGIILFLTLTIFTSLAYTAETELKVSDCKWAESSYDSDKYIRVIRKAGAAYPINYLCWERDKVRHSIFFNLKNCMLAVSDEGGIDCNLCKLGYHV